MIGPCDPQQERQRRERAELMQKMIACGAVRPPARRLTTQDALRQVWRENQNMRNAKKRSLALSKTCLYCKNPARGGNRKGAFLCQSCYDGE